LAYLSNISTTTDVLTIVSREVRHNKATYGTLDQRDNDVVLT